MHSACEGEPTAVNCAARADRQIDTDAVQGPGIGQVPRQEQIPKLRLRQFQFARPGLDLDRPGAAVVTGRQRERETETQSVVGQVDPRHQFEIDFHQFARTDIAHAQVDTPVPVSPHQRRQVAPADPLLVRRLRLPEPSEIGSHLKALAHNLESPQRRIPRQPERVHDLEWSRLR